MNRTVILLMLVFGLALPAVGQVPEIFYLQCNEGTGTTTADLAIPGVGAAPTLAGAIGWETTNVGLGSASLLNTGASGNKVDTNVVTNLSGDWTLEFMVRDDASTTTLRYMFGDNTASTFRCFSGGVAGTNGLWLRGGGMADTMVNGLVTGTWHHVAFVYDSVAGTCTPYLDGVAQAASTQPTGLVITGTAATGISFGGYSTSGTWVGALDEFRMWSQARSATDIAANMSNELTCNGLPGDLKCAVITGPDSSPACAPLSNAEQVTIVIQNIGSFTIPMGAGIPVEYTVDDGVNPVVTVTDTHILAADLDPCFTVVHTFATTADLSTPGMYTINARTNEPTDPDMTNDAAAPRVVFSGSQFLVNTFPWLENFDALTSNTETPPPGWTQDTADGDNWDFRSGSTPSTNTGPTGDNTSGTGIYAHTEDSNVVSTAVNLITPCLDVTALANPTLRFYVHSNAASGTDENFLAIDILDANGAVLAADVITPIGHLGNTWQLQFVDLTPYIGQIFQIQFRGRTDGPSFTHDIAIDDVEVFDLSLPDLAMDAILEPAASTQLTCGPQGNNATVTVQIRNFGLTIPAGTMIPVSFTADDGINPPQTVNEMMTLAANLVPGATAQYTFTTGADLTNVGLFTFSASVALPSDPFGGNDTLTGHMFQNGGANVINTFPHLENFDTHTTTLNDTTPPTDWLQPTDDATGTNSDWFFRNTPTTTTTTGPPSDHTTGVSGVGWYAYVEDSATHDNVSLVTPCFDTTALTTPFLTFWVHSNDFNGLGAPSNNTLSVDVLDEVGGVTHSDVVTLGHLGDFWQKIGLDLTPFASNGFRIRFRVNANNSDTDHDIAIDDVEVGEAPAFGNGQPPVPGKGTLDINSAQEANGFLVSSGAPGPYFASQAAGTGTLDFTITGTASQAFILVAGVTNPNAANFPPIGQFDIGVTNPVPPFVPTGLTVIFDGTNPVIPGPFYNTGADGEWNLSVLTPNVPGLNVGLQAICLTGDAQVAQMSNAVDLMTP